MSDPLFSETEYLHLMRIGKGKMGATDDQLLMFVRECEKMRINALTLELILAGYIEVTGYSSDDFSIKGKALPGQTYEEGLAARVDIWFKHRPRFNL